MSDNQNPLKTAELATEQNGNMIDGIMNNAPLVPAVPAPDQTPLDKVRPPTRRSPSHDREDR